MKNIIFLQPLFHDPTLPNFKDRFEMLSEHFRGHVVGMTNKPEQFDGIELGGFVYHAVPTNRNRIKKYLVQFYRVLKVFFKTRSDKIDVIHSYDPLLLGMTSVFLKWMSGAKLIIEVNGHLKKDAFLQARGLRAKLKRAAFKMMVRFSLAQADMIKFLNEEQKEEWSEFLRGKKTIMFHDFVATHVFRKDIEIENYIFFIGYPFYRKGVDVLIEAFLKISGEYPDLWLKIVGHCPGGDAERQKYIDMAQGNPNIEILKPVYYDEAVKLFEKCRLFVLPSRSEAMGRVLIEAMAAGKPVIGADVGGIPGIIKDGENGFLFESENSDQLAAHIRALLDNQDLYHKMSGASLRLIESDFSSERYVENFNNMVEALDD